MCGIRQGSAVDHPELFTGSDRTSWELSIVDVFHPTFTSHGGKLSQPIDAGENGIREVVSGFWIFESDIVHIVFQIFECFSNHSTSIPAPAPSAHGGHLVIGGEFAVVGFLYCQLDLGGHLVLDVVAKNVQRQGAQCLTVDFGQVGERVG